MGLFDKLQTNEPKEITVDEAMHELKIQRNRILSEIGKKFVEQNKGRSMYGTGYEELFKQLSDIERVMNADITFDRQTGGSSGFSDVEEDDGPPPVISYTKAIITGVVVLVIVIIATSFTLLRGKPRLKTDDKKNSTQYASVTGTAEGTNTEEEGTDSSVSDEDLMEKFHLSSSNVADYGSTQVTDHTQYLSYKSDTGSFSFSYPSELYNDVKVVKDEKGGTYGRIINQISMSGSDGSTGVFTVYENWITSKSNSLESKVNYVVKNEKAELFSPMIKVNDIKDESFGVILMTAYADDGASSDCVYDLCRVDQDYVYKMRLTYPRPKDEQEDKNKAYFADTMYKLCGFSGADVTTPDSYETFVQNNYSNFTLKDWQKKIFWNMLDNMVTSRGLYDAYGKERVVPVGNKNELAGTLSNDNLVLQMYLRAGLDKDREGILGENIACIVDNGADGKKMFYKADVGEEAFAEYYRKASAEKDLLSGSLGYAKTFYRDLFGMELDVNNVLQDNKSILPGDMDLLLYNRDYNDLVYVSGYVVKNRVDGPDDWDYNKELDCFDYHMGPVYELGTADTNWEQKRDEKDPGNGIYVAHIRPYINNSVGFKLLGIERVE